MKRREFLKWLAGAVAAFSSGMLISGCGGSNSISATTSRKAQITLNGKTSKTVSVNAGETVLDAIKKAFPYRKLEEATIIDGTEGNWRYSLNGAEPDIYAGDCVLDCDSTIRLQLI